MQADLAIFGSVQTEILARTLSRRACVCDSRVDDIWYNLSVARVSERYVRAQNVGCSYVLVLLPRVMSETSSYFRVSCRESTCSIMSGTYACFRMSGIEKWHSVGDTILC
jgi:hypothetical protein